MIRKTLEGKDIKTRGHFEFVLKRGNKMVSIVEAKKDDMEQGIAENLLGCEAVADVEKWIALWGLSRTTMNGCF